MIAINKNAYEFFKPWLADLPSNLQQININNLCFDSREVQAGDAFVVIPSVAGKEAEYVKAAADNGALLIISDEDFSSILNVNNLQIANLTQVLGEIIHHVLGSACEKMTVLGITGTNGKSSISFYLAQLLNKLQKPCAVMGTLGYGDLESLNVTGMTTLPLEKLHLALQEMSQNHDAVAMEVSSHGLDQGRLAGVKFKGAIYSNLTRDHLDYHGDMASYGAAKAKLFNWPDLEFAIINADDDFAQELVRQSSCDNIVSYGQSVNGPLLSGKHSSAHLSFSFEKIHSQGMTVNFTWQKQSQLVDLPLYGEFNAYNVAAALACTLQMGFAFTDSIKALAAMKAVPGRMQQITGNGLQPLVLVDYAHTPDALKQALQAVKQHCPGNIHLVVGCGGDRDTGKRSLMGEIAQQFADKIIITSDNPRSESPQKICEDIVASLSANRYQIELDRKIAIQTAINAAGPNDLVVIAGKGHEDYQEINGKRIFFSDEQVAKEALQIGSQK